jgi:hypothetical protein
MEVLARLQNGVGKHNRLGEAARALNVDSATDDALVQIHGSTDLSSGINKVLDTETIQPS